MNTFLRVFSVILLTSAIITGLLVFLRRRFVIQKETLKHFQPSIFSFFASLYAFFLGFAFVTLWSAYLNTEANVAKEADNLLVAFRTSKDLQHSEGFRQSLADYVKKVVEDEWPQMEQDRMSEEANKLFDQVWEQLHRLKADNKSDTDIYANIASLLGEASRHRRSRALLMKGNLYPPIWVIIVFGFMWVCYGLYFTHMMQEPVIIVFDFMVVFIVLSCIYFIYDINTPFSGYITVSPDVFEKVHAQMQALK